MAWSTFFRDDFAGGSAGDNLVGRAATIGGTWVAGAQASLKVDGGGYALGPNSAAGDAEVAFPSFTATKWAIEYQLRGLATDPFSPSVNLYNDMAGAGTPGVQSSFLSAFSGGSSYFFASTGYPGISGISPDIASLSVGGDITIRAEFDTVALTAKYYKNGVLTSSGTLPAPMTFNGANLRWSWSNTGTPRTKANYLLIEVDGVVVPASQFWTDFQGTREAV